MAKTHARYHDLAIALHWIMALAFFTIITLGLVMTGIELPKSLEFQMYQWHKSLGILLLLSFFLRLMIRLVTKKPDLPASLNPLEKKVSKLGHYVLYLWMLILPISGWIMVSSSSLGLPTIVFGWFEWPHIPNVANDKEINSLAKETHELLSNIFMVLIAAHIAAVIKHKIIDKENLLQRMWFTKK